MRIRSSLTLACTLLCASTVSATLLDQGSTVLDSRTQLEWLKPNETRTLTYSELLAHPTLFAEGWTFASYDQLAALFATAGLPTFSHDLEYVPAIDAITSVFGDSFDTVDNAFFGVYGYTRAPDCSTCIATPHAMYAVDSTGIYVHIETPGFIDTTGYTVVGAQGAFLVRAAPIPEPSAGLLMMLGLAALLRWRRAVTHCHRSS